MPVTPDHWQPCLPAGRYMDSALAMPGPVGRMLGATGIALPVAKRRPGAGPEAQPGLNLKWELALPVSLKCRDRGEIGPFKLEA